MIVIEALEQANNLIAGGSVVSIGNFDGLHLGHRSIIERNIALAKQQNLLSLVITFEPHPMTFFNPRNRLRRLNLPADKIELIGRLAPDVLVVLKFTRALAGMSAEQFVRRILLPQCKLQALVVGTNFALGKGRAGNLESLRSLGRSHAFKVLRVAGRKDRGELISSSKIRAAVERGDVVAARRMLGRPFFLRGKVVHGKKRGRKWGVPTLNVEKTDQLWPADGVYICRALVGEADYAAAVNLGLRPTFGGQERLLEAHLLDFSGDLYGREGLYLFYQRLRDELRYEDPKELFAQIEQDISATRAFFRRRSKDWQAFQSYPQQ